MFRRPSNSHRTSQNAKSQVELNLVPMMDALVTLVAFLLYSMTLIAFVGMESPVPITNPLEVQKKIQENPLQLTLSINDEGSEIWSPFDKIPAKKIPHTAEGFPDLVAIHETLVQIKAKFPAEKSIVLIPVASVNYEVLVAVMDSIRIIATTDTPIYYKDEKTGVDTQADALFPEVIFGNLLGG